MSKRRRGSRYILLVPKRAMGRLWKPSFLTGLLLALILWQTQKGNLIFDRLDNQFLLVGGMIFALLFGAFALAARNMNYVQAYPTHLRLVTPFLRLKISYRRIQSSHPVNFGQIYPPAEMRWAPKRVLRPFFDKTGLAVRLAGFPLPYRFLRLFLAPQVFLPSKKGFLFLVEDWITLSTEIDSLAESWRAKTSHKQ